MRSEPTIQTAPATRRASFLRLRRLSAVLPLLAITACGDENGGPLNPVGAEVAAVEVTAPAPAMTVGTTMQLGVTPRGRSGAPLAGVAIAWSSSDATVAAVSAAGLVTAIAPGQAVIRATGGGRTGEAAITVVAPQVATLQITPGGEIELQAGAGTQLHAVARTEAGVPVGVAAAWSSSDERVATVSATGAVHARGAGTAVIRVAAGGKAAEVAVRVRTQVSFVLVLPGGTGLRVGEALDLRARAVSAAGDTLVRAVEWASENEGVATVDAQGRVTARRPGSAVIRATVEGVAGRALVSVAGTTEHRLELAAGQALPAQVGTRSFRDAAGVLHEQRVVVTGGALRFGNGYEQRITLEVYEGDVRLSTEVYEDRGDVWYDVFTGTPILRSTLRPGLEVRAELLSQDGYPTGEVAVRLALAGEGQEVVLRFGPP